MNEPRSLLVKLLDPRGILCGGLFLHRTGGSGWPREITSEIRRKGVFIRSRRFVLVDGTDDQYREVAAAATRP